MQREGCAFVHFVRTEGVGGRASAGSRAVRREVYKGMTFRVLGPHERGRFAPEAWGHLLALSGAGILNPAELEHVIERALTQIDGRIALDDLRALMEGAGLMDDGPAGDGTTLH